MNALFAGYATAAIQVTLLGLVTVALHGLLAKRRPDTAVFILATSSVLTILVTIAALVPLPRSWELALPSARAGSLQSTDPATASAHASERNHAESLTSPAVPLISLLTSVRGWLARATALETTEKGHSPRWPAWLAAAVVAAIGLLLARLIGGVWSARRFIRSSRPVADVQLLRQVHRIRRELGCLRRVEILASPAIPTAATIGWRRPVLLLSPSWRTWSDLETTAVLAHELTHVRRLDYLVGMLARVAGVLHFYNPLVRWMAAGISFAQEAVADEAAARSVGSRKLYLVALTKLALRQDRPLNSLPVLAFAFTSSTFLMRRIQMLQTTDGPRRSSRTLHAAVFASLVVFATAASTLRQSAHSEESGPENVRIANKQSAATQSLGAGRGEGGRADSRPSLDLSYLPDVQHGLVGIRPKAIFARPDLRPVTAMIDAAIREQVAARGIEEDISFSIADLEQVLGPVTIEVVDPHGDPGNRGRIMMGLSAIRSEKRIPLQELLAATHPAATVTEGGGRTVIETSDAAIPALGPMRHFAMPDQRTVLPGIGGEALNKLIERPANELISAKPWFALWQRVEQDAFAIVLDNSAMHWQAPLDDIDLPHAKALAAHARHVALGCDLQGDELNVELIVECADADKSDLAVDGLKGLLDWSIREAEKIDAWAGPTHDADYLRRLYVAALIALHASSAEVDGATVSLKASVNVDANAVAALAGIFTTQALHDQPSR